MRLSTVTIITTVLLLLLLPVKGALPRKLDPDEVMVQDQWGNWLVCPAPPAAQAPPIPFRFVLTLVNSPIIQPAASPTNVPIRIEHEINIGNDIRHTQLSSLKLISSSHNDGFMGVGFNSNDGNLLTGSTDSNNDSEDTTPSSRPRSRHFNLCCPSIPTPAASASSPDDPEWFDDGLELFDDEPECVDGLKDDASVAAFDSAQPVPTSEPKSKKRKATNKVSINVAATVHSTLH